MDTHKKARSNPKLGSRKQRRKSVLLVDDNPEMLDLYSRLIRTHGLRVQTAGDGMQGLKILRGRTVFDFIVSDLMMPRMDGIEFLKRSGSLRPLARRILLTTSEPDAKRLNEIRSLGVRIILKTAALKCLLEPDPPSLRGMS